jgi:hypothetical protein
MPGYAGLQTTPVTWLIFAGLITCWLVSLRLVPNWTQEGWPSLLKSFYGIVWMGFGLDIILRFLELTYNAVEWSSGSLRLVALPPATISATLAWCTVYWFMVCLGFGVVVRRPGQGPFRHTKVFTPEFSYAIAVPSAALALLGFYLTEGPSRLPLALLTPIGLLSNLYMVPAAVIWWDHFRRPGPKWRIGAIHLLVLLPGLVRAWVSPYRENLAPIFLIPLIAALFAGKRPALRKLVPAALIWLLLVTTVVASYRRIKWENARPNEVLSEFQQATAADWFTGSWADSVRRFHGFDSMLLTVALVPSLEPHSGRDVLFLPFVHGFVPRFLYGNKSRELAGTNFGERIWAFDDPVAREQRVGNIAPSMPGDLFEAGGVLFVALGGMIWGIVLALADGWKKHLPPYCAAAVLPLLMTHCAMSIERDFDLTVATFIQMLLVTVLVSGAIAMVSGRVRFSLGSSQSSGELLRT